MPPSFIFYTLLVRCEGGGPSH